MERVIFSRARAWLAAVLVVGCAADPPKAAPRAANAVPTNLPPARFHYLGRVPFSRSADLLQTLFGVERGDRYVLDLVNSGAGPAYDVSVRFFQLPQLPGTDGTLSASDLEADAPRVRVYRLPLATPRAACAIEACSSAELDAPATALVAERTDGVLTFQSIAPDDRGARLVFEYDQAEPPLMASAIQWCTSGCGP
jgi:hypothetical protein